MTTWRTRTARDLIDYMQATMPPGRPSLAETDYVNIAAFILRSNGAAAGSELLRASSADPIGSVATGQRAAAVPLPVPVMVTAPAAPAGPPPSRGHSVQGEVRNYVPVTDAMLKNPPPGDWLMARRNYQAWSYSPLDEITRQRQGAQAGVELVDERGRRQPADAARAQRRHVSRQHRYMMQALDAATGDLIWEHQVGPNSIRGFGAVRNLAIYGDKVFMATNDGRLVAFDARNGKLAWETTIVDPKSGLPTRADRSSRAAR